MSEKKKVYWVEVPIIGSAVVPVIATSEDEACDYEAVMRALDDELVMKEVVSNATWEYREKIVTGNVFHGPCNGLSVVDEEELES